MYVFRVFKLSFQFQYLYPLNGIFDDTATGTISYNYRETELIDIWSMAMTHESSIYIILYTYSQLA